jgi:tetratricopeptide (TPR) repeat protein
MAEAYFILSHTLHHEFVKHINKVEEYAEKILELDPESSFGYCYLGLVRWKEPKPKEGVKLLKRAFDIDPNDIHTLEWLSFCASEIGKPAVAEPCVKKLLETNPLDAWSQFSLGWYYLMSGRLEPALQPSKKAHKMAPESPMWGFHYARVLALNHQLKEACSFFDRIAKDSPQETLGLLSPFYKYVLQGERAKALKYMTKELKEAVRMDETLSLFIAESYALIDDKEEAIDWLEHAVWRGVLNYPYLSNYDPFLENIRGEKRFKKLMERVKYEWENFEV